MQHQGIRNGPVGHFKDALESQKSHDPIPSDDQCILGQILSVLKTLLS